MAERLVEQRLAAARGIGGFVGQAAADAEFRIGQKGDFLDVGFQRVEHLLRRLRSGEFIDDGVADEIAQRGKATVMSIGREIFRPTQARRRHRVDHAIVGLRIEQRPADVEGTGSLDSAGNEQLGIVMALLVAGFATDAGLARDAAEKSPATKTAESPRLTR